MSNQIKTKKLIRSVLNPNNLFCRANYLFIFSHMRSRSTLLAHILGSNSEICGYNELHQAYEDKLSLLKMRVKLNYDVDGSFQNKYLLDKVLHNAYSITDDIMQAVQPKVIFLLRNAESSLQSIIRMGKYPATQEYANPYVAMDYYCGRLQQLAAYSSQLEQNYFFIESDDLLTQNELVLGHLSNWLGLKEPLSKNYSTFRNTGKHGFGDMSDHIKAGVIHETGNYPALNFPIDVLHEAHNAYKSCKATLIKNQRIASQATAGPQSISNFKTLAHLF